jgi:hypothetical protein
MFTTPYQVMMAARDFNIPVRPTATTNQARWTWIAGRRYRSIDRS